ncbi:MAG: hypothetical protein K5696_08520 [Lachnospiraceae bacterium]|nr:hypothetical protein [Lachnospiraceae bacterium]
MAYFDSEKNKAIWAKRLSVLEQERDRRKQNGFKPAQRLKIGGDTAQSEEARPGVRIITFEQLVAKEEARHQERVRQARAVARQVMQEPQMQPHAQIGGKGR